MKIQTTIKVLHMHFTKTNHYLKHLTFKVILISQFLSLSNNLKSQKDTISEGYSEFKLENHLTLAQSEQLAIDAAKINAIENVFGSLILEGNTLYTLNKQNGKKSEFDQVFNSISEIYVNGEWMRDIEKPILNKIIKNQEFYISVKVKGLVRELKTRPDQFIAKTLSCSELPCSTENFTNGQQLFLFVKVPIDGFISIYIDIPSEYKTYRLLPYKSQRNIDGTKIIADTDTYFFSKEKPGNQTRQMIDEMLLSLTESKKMETNKIYILFSPVPFNSKPILSAQSTVASTQTETPLNLNPDEFMKWLNSLRKNNPDIQLKTIYITIKP